MIHANLIEIYSQVSFGASTITHSLGSLQMVLDMGGNRELSVWVEQVVRFVESTEGPDSAQAALHSYAEGILCNVRCRFSA